MRGNKHRLDARTSRSKTFALLARHWFIIFTILSFSLITAYYMRSSVQHCTSVVYGFGDSTGGPIWRFGIDPHHPLGGPETATNFPVGENLYNPVGYSLILQTLLFWTFAKLAGPICGFNLLNIIGFISSALIMTGFIYWLTKRKWLSWLAGYLVTFAPYFQTKVGSHPGYGYQALLIGVLWTFLLVYKTGKKKWAVTLSIISAACFYFDPYFTLLVLTILLPLLSVYIGAWLIRWLRYRKVLPKHLAAFALSALLFVIALLPLVYVKVHFRAQIDSSVSSSRGSVIEAGKICSIYPYEYLLPFPANPLVVKSHLFGADKTVSQTALYGLSTCNRAEDSIGVSLLVLASTVAGLVILAWEAMNRRLEDFASILSVEPVIIVTGLVSIIGMAFLIALPPIKVFGIPTLSFVLLHLTSIWRIVEREFVVLHIALITLFSVVAAYFVAHIHISKKVGFIIFVLFFLGVFAEYQTFNPMKSGAYIAFDYRNMPSAYFWLSKEQDIKAIAEYPLERVGTESDAMVYYATAQSIHKKPMLNSELPLSPEEVIRSSLKNLSDPQTVSTLRSLGVDAVVVHGVAAEEVAKIPHLQVVFAGNHGKDGRVPPSRTITDGQLVIAKIVDAPKSSAMLTFAREPLYNAAIIKSAVDWQYEIQQDNTFLVKRFGTSSENLPFDACFNIKMASHGDNDVLDLIIDNSSSQQLSLDSEYSSVRVSAVKSIRLHNHTGHNMRVTKIGCSE